MLNVLQELLWLVQNPHGRTYVFLYDSQFFIRVWMTCVRVSEMYYHVTEENASA